MPYIDTLPNYIQKKLAVSRYCIHGSVGFIYLTQGYVTLVDASAVPVLTKNYWYAHASNLYKPGRPNATPKIYAARTINGSGKSRRLYLHRLLTGAEPGQVVMHLNENGLDNRLENLKVSMHAENMAGREGIEPVEWEY